MPGQRQLGSPFKASQPMTLGLSGFGGVSICFQPVIGWSEDQDAWRRESLHRRFIEVREVPPRRSRITPSPGASLHPARNSRRCVRLFANSDHPSDHVGETFGIPFANLADFPSVLHPEGLRFLGVLLGWFAH